MAILRKEKELFAQKLRLRGVKKSFLLYILYILRVVSYNLKMTAAFLVQSFRCIVVVVVALLFYVHGKHLRSCRDGQLT